jgi:membrane-associated PAP2 superfamily phosphatase
MKKFVVIVAAVVVCVLAWLIFAKVQQHRRQAAYMAALAPFQHALPIGTSRVSVEEYLHANGVRYNAVEYGGERNWTYQVKIGEESGSLVCDPWQVYVAMEFDPTNRLKDVRLSKVGTCL